MRGLLHRSAVAFALGALLVAAAVAGRAAHAALGGDVVNACVKPSSGTLYLIGGESGRTALRPTDLAAPGRGRSGLAEPARLADAPLRLLTERRGAARAAPRSLRC